ncbi:MAG: DNA methylase N-4, partial [Hyphomicrobium denitrificans]|nr:DNA methylase N-4 [Hyphomicrobium denitrificans]
MASTKRTARIGTAEQDDYQAFLQAKIALAPSIGVDVDAGEINPALRPHCKPIVQWALRGGCRAIFASFGLHKTTMQIEIIRLLGKKKGVRRLIVLPLGVRQEFMRDAAERFKGRFKVRLKFIRSADELEPEGKDDPIYLTNYETVRDGRLDPNIFGAASLDEASVLRSYGTKTYHEFLRLFADVTFKFVATATPSPNRYKELIHYAGFLGIMDTGLALTRFFQRDSTSANNLTLYPHKEDEFWLWMHSWAIFIQKPSDLGFSDEGYDLPPLDVRYHEVATDHSRAGVEKDGQHLMFKDAALGVTQAASEKRESLTRRVAKMREIIAADPREHMLLWHDLEDERRAIEAAVPTSVSVFGAQDLETREENVIAFSEGKLQYLATKPELSGSGCNFQRHCHTAVFLGIGFKFNDFIQAIHRVQRFGQTKPCRIHLIYTEAEREVLRVLRAKWARHEEMMKRMSEIIRKYGLDHIEMSNTLKRSIGVKRVEVSSDRYKIANNDCVLEARLQAENSVDLIVTSVPFSNHYEYTDKYEDFGHTDNNDHFWHQMDFLTPELFRILKPGRLACIHVKDRILFGNVTGSGAPTVSPFHAETIFHMKKHGFDFMGMITIVTDVVRENNQTYRLGWSENCKDGTKMGVGSPEYVILARKPQTDRSKGYADLPVTKSKADYTRARWQVDAHAFWRSSGNRQLTAGELASLGPDKLAKAFTEYSLSNLYDYEFHVKIGEELDATGALPSTFMSLAPGSHSSEVWHDINRMLTLNGQQARRNVEFHICPLQFDIVDRLIERYSNPDELVYDPFGGLMTVPYRAILKGRRGQASELNHVSFLDGAASELVIPSQHSVQENPLAILEI